MLSVFGTEKTETIIWCLENARFNQHGLYEMELWGRHALDDKTLDSREHIKVSNEQLVLCIPKNYEKVGFESSIIA